jgi:predicted Fe-Mo cluster-binding NifX family protein
MKIALPLDAQLVLYKQNPFTAPKFGIYLIETTPKEVLVRLDAIMTNPMHAIVRQNFLEDQIVCDCDERAQNCFNHICEHYSLLEVIGGCRYLLADNFCKNTCHTLKNGGVEVFKIPSIIKTAEMAIKNFLIGANLAKKISHIRNLS